MRVGIFWRYILFWYFPLSTLHIWTPSKKIDGGLYIGHGCGTVINAEWIGKNCLIGQNCTIGSRNLKAPRIGDYVSIWAHAVIIGGITIGDNSQIGAGAVVVKSVPNDSVIDLPNHVSYAAVEKEQIYYCRYHYENRSINILR